MPHPNKRQRPTSDDASLAEATAADGGQMMMAASVGDLSTDVLAKILGFFGLKDIMQKRRVNKRWGEAVKKTTVPLKNSYFYVDSTIRYNAMRVITRALPNLQQIDLYDPDEGEWEYMVAAQNARGREGKLGQDGGRERWHEGYCRFARENEAGARRNAG